MPTATTLIATVDRNHMIKAPAHLAVGEQVLVMPIPSIAALLNDPVRRARFAATRKAIQEAIAANSNPEYPADAEIVSLVKRARQATRHS